MKNGFLKIAEGFEMIAAGYRALAEGEVVSTTQVDTTKAPTTKVNASTKGATKVTVEDVRAVLAEKTRDGKTKQVRELLNAFGADKLSSVPEDKLAELKEKAEVL